MTDEQERNMTLPEKESFVRLPPEKFGRMERDDIGANESWQGYGKPEGTKHDAGKPIFGAIPPFAELEVARVMEFGCQKYSRGNWSAVDNLQERYMDAALRHLNAVRRGERLDDESGFSHLAHAACCVLFMLDDEMRGGK